MVEVKVKRVVAYCRVSSESQVDNTSIAEQMKKIEAYCVSQDLVLVKVFTDEGESGSNTDRNAYNEMLDFIATDENQSQLWLS